MARISLNDANKFETNTKSKWFSLKDDRDTAVVRFMYNDLDDVSMDVVHTVQVDGKDRYVNCPRSYDDPMDACPLCKAGFHQQIKLFIPLYNEQTGEVQIWQRGKTFGSQLSSLASRYNPLCSTPIEIERQGKKGDQSTKYQLYPRQSDETKMRDLPEVPKIIGGIVLDKSYDELSYYAENGCFKTDGVQRRENNENTGIQRRTTNRPQF